MKILGYVRLSRDHREESTSIVRQREIIALTCAARGFELIDTIEDVGVSASKSRLDRPGLDEIRARLRGKEADAVMVWRLDRLVRSVTDVGVLLDEGLQIISATENLDTTTIMGRAMVEILQVFAAMEAKTIGLRVTASRAHLRKVGRFAGGVVAYGYRTAPHPDGAGRTLEPDPTEAAVVRRMADEVLGGASVYSVATGLNADGIPTRRGRAWSTTVVRSILRDGAALGRVREGSTPRPNGKGRIPGDFIRDPETGLPVVYWEPLLSLDEVERIRTLTEWATVPGHGDRTRAGLQRRKASRLLSGLMTCPGCGLPLAVRSLADSPRPAVYVCGANKRGEHCPGGVTVQCDYVEQEVTRRFLADFGHLEVVETRSVTRAVAGLAEIDELIREVTEAMRSPRADHAALSARVGALHAQRALLDSVPQKDVPEVTLTGETFAEAWPHLDIRGRRNLLVSAGLTVGIRRVERRGKWDPTRVVTTYAAEYEEDPAHFDD